MQAADSGRTIVVHASRVGVYGRQPSLQVESLPPAAAWMKEVEWRLKRAKLNLVRPTAIQLGIDPTPDGGPYGLSVKDRCDFWLQRDDLEAVIEVATVMVECPVSVLSDPSGLRAWIEDFSRGHHQAPLSKDAAVWNGTFPPSNTDWICVVTRPSQPEDLQAPWRRVGDNAWRRRLVDPTSDLWCVPESTRMVSDRDEVAMNAATVLQLFCGAMLKQRVCSDVVRGLELETESYQVGRSNDARLKVVALNHWYLKARFSLDARRATMWSDLDRPVYDDMLLSGSINREVIDRKDDLESILAFFSEAASQERSTETLRATRFMTGAIAVLGALAAVAAVLQAIDKSDALLPFASAGSLWRAFMLLGLVSLLAALCLCVLLLGRLLVGTQWRLPLPAWPPRAKKGRDQA